MAQVAARKIVIVRKMLDATGEFNYNIDIPFHVHDMIFSDAAAGQSTAGPYADPWILSMVGVGDISTFTEQLHTTVRHVFNVNRDIKGLQTFQIRNISGTNGGITSQVGCSLAFTLEFIQYLE